MLYILFGQDDFSLREALEGVKSELGDRELLATNTTVLNGQQLTLDQLKNICDTMPFLSQKRLVIVEQLLSRFEPRQVGQRGRLSRSGHRLTPRLDQGEQWRLDLPSYVTKMPASTVLVLVDGRIRSGNPLLGELSPLATVRTFPPLRGANLHRWIRKRVAEGSGNISPQAVNLLAELVGENLWIMTREIEKLLLYALGRDIEESDVERVVGYAREVSVFAMVDAILERQASTAGRLLHQLLDEGATPPYLLVMITRQLRQMVLAKELSSKGITRTETRNRLGLTSEYALDRTLRQAKRYPMEQLVKAYHQLLETDIAIKTGRWKDEVALDLLVAELCLGGKA